MPKVIFNILQRTAASLWDCLQTIFSHVKPDWQTHAQNELGWTDLRKEIQWLIKISSGAWGPANLPNRRNWALCDFVFLPIPGARDSQTQALGDWELSQQKHCPRALWLCVLLWRFAFKLLLYPGHEKSANDRSLFRWHPSTLRNSPFVLSQFDIFPVCGASLVSWHLNLIILFANGLYFSVSVCKTPVGLIICPLFSVRRCRANL